MAVEFKAAIREVLQLYDTKLQLKEGQLQVLKIFLENRKDILVSLPTGYGKSIIFHLLAAGYIIVSFLLCCHF